MNCLSLAVLIGVTLTTASVHADQYAELPIADVHVHYSHDSVELTPPARVVELMESANLKFALVSSSDDNGTQILTRLAPDLIIPGLRPYRRRGESSTWFTDDDALAYVERSLNDYRYATIGEFHLYGETADLPIPRKIVELADEHNLVLHAHSDAEAITRLLAQSDTVKVIWAHSGFDEPSHVADLLRQHDRLYADLAFRSEMGRGGNLSEAWVALFEEFPNRMMLGTDTYTPERMYFIPEHAEVSRSWLASLPFDLAERVAWKNAYDLLMPIWQSNRQRAVTGSTDSIVASDSLCNSAIAGAPDWINGKHFKVKIEPLSEIQISEPFSAKVHVCGELAEASDLVIDMRMPAHGHGMNYEPEVSRVSADQAEATFQVDGLFLHMAGAWEWKFEVKSGGTQETLTHDLQLQ